MEETDQLQPIEESKNQETGEGVELTPKPTKKKKKKKKKRKVEQDAPVEDQDQKIDLQFDLLADDLMKSPNVNDSY